MDGNVKDTPPVIFVPAEGDRETWASLDGRIKDAKQQLEARKTSPKPAFEAWAKPTKPADVLAKATETGLRLRATLNGGRGATELYTLDGKDADVVAAQGRDLEARPVRRHRRLDDADSIRHGCY